MEVSPLCLSGSSERRQWQQLPRREPLQERDGDVVALLALQAPSKELQGFVHPSHSSFKS